MQGLDRHAVEEVSHAIHVRVHVLHRGLNVCMAQQLLQGPNILARCEFSGHGMSKAMRSYSNSQCLGEAFEGAAQLVDGQLIAFKTIVEKSHVEDLGVAWWFALDAIGSD